MLDVRRFLARMRGRSLRNAIKLLQYRLHPYFRYNTPLKALNLSTVKVQKWLRCDIMWGMPYRYNIDPTNVCNLRCPVCPTGLGILGREQGRMTVESFQALVDQLARYAYVLELYNWGEPFLHPGIFDMIRYAHDHRVSVGLSSNLNYFSREMAEKTVSSGLDRIIVSVDGSTQAAYEAYRRGGDLSRVLDHVNMLVDEKERQKSRYPFVLMRMLINRHNEHQIEELRQISEDIGADAFSTGAFLIDTTDQAQIEDWLPTEEKHSCYCYSKVLKNVSDCSDLWEAMTLNWDGGVAPCCWVHRQEHDFSNASERPIADIWNSESYVNSRRVFGQEPPLNGHTTICMLCQGEPRHLKD